jgi:type IV pilus assembly protein PilY1
LNSYYDSYNDFTYMSFTQTTGSTGYKERGMVFAGGNDGMLHAFKLGKLELSWTGQGYMEKARLAGSDL